MQKIIFGVVGGLGLFIFGMKYLSDGLQQVASNKVKRIMTKLTNNPIKAVSLGAFVTSIVQSSSVTTVMLIGLINAGIITLVQGASVVLGANIGTTITAQIIAFKISKYALPGIAIGTALMFVGKKEKVMFWGQIILALGLIFLGLKTVSGVVKPLKDIPAVVEFFILLSRNPILGILSGTLLTVLIQSSSASIGMLIALATAGLIDFRASLYVLLGTNIGTTITAWLASIGGTLSAKRLAGFHTIFNIIGAAYFAVFIYLGLYERVIDYITPGALAPDTIARHIANGHTLFNVVNTLIFIPFIGFFIILVEKLLPGKPIALSPTVKYLQDNLIETPELALASAKKEIGEMAKLGAEVIKSALNGFKNKDISSVKNVEKLEDQIDELQRDITIYLSKISNERLTDNLSMRLPVFIHSINDIERISDICVNISELTDDIVENNVEFTEYAVKEFEEVYNILSEMLEISVRAITAYEPDIQERIASLEDKLNKLHKEILDAQAERVMKKICMPKASLIFINLMHNIERIGDHLTNIAQAASQHFYYDESKI